MGESPFTELVIKLGAIVDAMRSPIRQADQRMIGERFQVLSAFANGLSLGLRSAKEEAVLDSFIEAEAERSRALDSEEG